jgi:hypothetical protein
LSQHANAAVVKGNRTIQKLSIWIGVILCILIGTAHFLMFQPSNADSIRITDTFELPKIVLLILFYVSIISIVLLPSIIIYHLFFTASPWRWLSFLFVLGILDAAFVVYALLSVAAVG